MQCGEIEVLLSGYIDGELPLQQAQQVEAHLATCDRCQAVVAELASLKKATGALSYQEPSSLEWQLMEQLIFQRISRGLGWVILVVWSAATLGYALFHLAVSPDEPLFEKILVFGIFLGMALLFLSVLSERVRDSRTDRYKGVQK